MTGPASSAEGPRFGTAGLRAPMGEGPHEFNTALVARATRGLDAYLTQRQVRGPVVIGFDARHGSAGFAAVAAAVLRDAGRDALVMPRELPTPVLAFAVRHLAAAAGVMITASHNPASDNGYKLYLADGAQIAPPDDAALEAAMAAALDGAPRGTRAETVPESVMEAYLTRAASLVPPGPRALRVTYTPLHGVAGATFARAWAHAGFPPYVEVAEQATPDPDFPTVAFPNPEEAGALDLAVTTAVRADSELVLAHDPDGDRCAVMVRDADGFRRLSGDEVGVLLAEQVLADAPAGDEGPVATTIVSSPLLERVAAAHGRRCVRTLTGFKWLARVPGLTYAYEEALGYCVDPTAVRDKDGITAALLLAHCAAQRPLTDRLDDIARRYGVAVSAPRSFRTTDSAAVSRLLTSAPRALGGVRVERVEDLTDSRTGLPPTPGVRLVAGPITAVLRPSGTEPKLKLYLHALGDPRPTDVAAERARLIALLDAAAVDLTTVFSGVAG